jgi:universal stress protein A
MVPKKILLCTDFSENSEPARTWVLDFARSFGAGIVILHVINASRLGYPAFDDGIPFDLQQVIESLEESVAKNLEELTEKCKAVVPDVTAFSRTGVPAGEIVRFAQAQGVDLIVMGTHGWTGIKHLILGSTAENLVRSADCPVLTVKSSSRQE